MPTTGDIGVLQFGNDSKWHYVFLTPGVLSTLAFDSNVVPTLKDIGALDGSVPINPTSQDTIDDPRTREIRRYTQQWINGQIAIETRLKDLRGEITSLKNFLHGDTLTDLARSTLVEIERKARFRAAVRAVGATLEATPGATSADGTWPLLSSFEVQALSSFWQDGPSMTVIAGLATALAGKTSPADVDAKISVAMAGLSTDTLATLSALAAELANHESMEATILAAVSTEATARASADTSEATARTAGDATNASALTAESSARLSADNTENARAVSAENTIAASVSTEATARASADATNATAITTETAARASAISSEASTRASADTTNANAIAAETTARGAADASEASTRAAADTANASAVSVEATTRATADTTLTTAVNGKEPAITAGTTLQYWRGDKTWQTLPTYGATIQNLTPSANFTITPAAGSSPTRTFTFVASSTNLVTATLGETSIAQASELTIINTSATTSFYVTDTAGVSEASGNFTVGPQDSISFVYGTDRWIEVGRSNN